MDQFLTVLIIISLVNLSPNSVSTQSLYRNEWNLITLIEQKYKMGLTAIDSDFILNLTAKDHSFQFPAQTIFSKLIILEDAFFYVKFYPTTPSFTILTIKDPHNTIRLRIRGFEKRDQLKQLRLSVFYDPISEENLRNYTTETEITVPFQKSMWTLGILLENRKITFYTSCEDVLKPLGYHQSRNSAPTNVKFFDPGSTLFLLNNGEINKNIEKFEGKISDFLLTKKSYVNEVMCQKNEVIEGSGRQSRKWEPHFMGNYLITEKSSTITMVPTKTLNTTISTAQTMTTASPRITSVLSTSTTISSVITSKQRIRSENQPGGTVTTDRNTIFRKIDISKISSSNTSTKFTLINKIITLTDHNIRTLKPKSIWTEFTMQTKIPLIMKHDTILSTVSSIEHPTNTTSGKNVKFSKSLEPRITNSKIQSDSIIIFKTITKSSNKVKTILADIFNTKLQTTTKNLSSKPTISVRKNISNTLKSTSTEQDNEIKLKRNTTRTISSNITRTTPIIANLLNETEPTKSSIKLTNTIKTTNDTIASKTTITVETQLNISTKTTNSANKSTSSPTTTTLLSRKNPITNTIKTHPTISTTIMALSDTNKTTMMTRSTKISSKQVSIIKNTDIAFISITTSISGTRSNASLSTNILEHATAELLNTTALLLNSTTPEKIRKKAVTINKNEKQYPSVIPITVLGYKTITTQKITELNTSELTNSSKKTSTTMTTKHIPFAVNTATTTIGTKSNVFVKTIVPSETITTIDTNALSNTTKLKNNSTNLFSAVNLTYTTFSSDSNTRSRVHSNASVTTTVQANTTTALLNKTKFTNISLKPVKVMYSTSIPTISNKKVTQISSIIPIIGHSKKSTTSLTTPSNKIKFTNVNTKSSSEKSINSAITLATTVTLRTKPTSSQIPIISLSTILLNGTEPITIKTKKKLNPSTKQMTSVKSQDLFMEQNATASIEKQLINSSLSVTRTHVISITPTTTVKSVKPFINHHIKVKLTSNITRTPNINAETSVQLNTTKLLPGKITLLKRTRTVSSGTSSTIKYPQYIMSSKGLLKSLTTPSVRKSTKVKIVPTSVNTKTTIHISKSKTVNVKWITSVKKTSKGCNSESLDFKETGKDKIIQMEIRNFSIECPNSWKNYVIEKGRKGLWGEMGKKGDKGSVGSIGQNGICNYKTCSPVIYLKGLKGETGQCLTVNCQKQNVNKGNNGSKGNKGDKGNAVKISELITFLLPEVKFTIDEIIKKNIINLKGEPGSCSCPPKSNGKQFKIQTIILNDSKELKSLSSNMPVGQMAFLISQNILLIKIDRVINRWREVKMDTSKRDWFFTSERIQKIPKSITLNVGSKLMLIALPKPTAGNLRSDSYNPGSYAGSSFLCQKEAFNYGLGRSFYPLLNTDMFDLSYMLPEKYRYGVPIVNRRNERIANSFVDLIQTSNEIGAHILDFRGDSIMSDENHPCVWIGEKPNLQEPKRTSDQGLCLNWMSKRQNNIATVAILKMNKPLFYSSGNHTKSCNTLCYVLCMQIYPLMSEARKH